MKTFKEFLNKIQGTRKKGGTPLTPLKITKSRGGHEMHSHDGNFVRRGHFADKLKDWAKERGLDAEGP